MKLAISALLSFSLSGAALAVSESNCSSQEKRQIKSLSQEEIDGYLSGKGMGIATPAELNNFPGPKHVIDLANELGLSNEQLLQTKKIYEMMRSEASEYGSLFVKCEQRIEALFSEGTVSPQLLQKSLEDSAKISAKLRGVHLMAHINQKSILSEQQVKLYNSLRGYTGSRSINEHKHHH